MQQGWSTDIASWSIEDKVFNISLTASLILHAFFLIFFLYSELYSPVKPVKQFDIVYQTTVEPPPKSPPAQEVRSLKNKTSQPRPEILTKKAAAPQGLLQDHMHKSPLDLNQPMKMPVKQLSIDGKKVIEVPMLESEKITNPKYLSYKERIRHKIKNRAYFYTGSPEFAAGQVYLTFVLRSTGELAGVKIKEQKTQANNYLRTVGLNSIKDSAPFPAFPSDLNYPELTFNVIISFTYSE